MTTEQEPLSREERRFEGRAARAVYEHGCVYVVACTDELVAEAFMALTGEECDASLVGDVMLTPPDTVAALEAEVERLRLWADEGA